MSETGEASPTPQPSPQKDFHRRWPTLKQPLRAPEDSAAFLAPLFADCADPILLLGVTPELAALPRAILAMDWSEAMVAAAWRGDDDAHQVIVADWKAMPLPEAAVGGAMGDGALTMLAWPHDHRHVLAELWRVVRPGGRIAIRCFVTPEQPETIDDLQDLSAAGALTFHEWRMRFNMAAARHDGNVMITSARLYELYDAAWPERHDYIDAIGWPGEAIAEIDAYRGSAYIHSYPKITELDALLHECWPGTWRYQPTTGYPGAEFCPLLVLERP